MTLDRNELDRYITQGPPDDPMWCPHCKSDSDECEQPDEHASDWSTYEEKAYYEDTVDDERLYDADNY